MACVRVRALSWGVPPDERLCGRRAHPPRRRASRERRRRVRRRHLRAQPRHRRELDPARRRDHPRDRRARARRGPRSRRRARPRRSRRLRRRRWRGVDAHALGGPRARRRVDAHRPRALPAANRVRPLRPLPRRRVRRQRRHGGADEGAPLREEGPLDGIRSAARACRGRGDRAEGRARRHHERPVGLRARRPERTGVGLPGLHRGRGRRAQTPDVRGERHLRRLPRRHRRDDRRRLLLSSQARRRADRWRRGKARRVVLLVAPRPARHSRASPTRRQLRVHALPRGERRGGRLSRQHRGDRALLRHRRRAPPRRRREPARRHLHAPRPERRARARARPRDDGRVAEQSFTRGRDPVFAPTTHAYPRPPLGEKTGILRAIDAR